MSAVAPTSNQPVLRFRLDPGEPGVLRTSSVSMSTVRVFAQETRNLTRLKAEAAREGRKVIYGDIRLGLRKIGNRVVATSGHTTVVSAESAQAVSFAPTALGPAEGVEEPRSEAPEPRAVETPEAELAGGVRAEESSQEEVSPDSAAELRRAETAVLQLKLQAARLEQYLVENDRAADEIETGFARVAVERSSSFAGERLRRINEEIRKVEFRQRTRKALRDGAEYLRDLA